MRLRSRDAECHGVSDLNFAAFVCDQLDRRPIIGQRQMDFSPGWFDQSDDSADRGAASRIAKFKMLRPDAKRYWTRYRAFA